MRNLNQNPFPGPIGLNGFQSIASTCREGAFLRLQSGLLDLRVTLVSVPTLGSSLDFVLHYRTQNSATTTELGHRWRHNYLMGLDITTSTTAVFTDASGVTYSYTKSGSTWSQSDGATLSATLIEDTGNSEWRLEFLEGTKLTFKSFSGGGTLRRLEKIEDKHQNATTLSYNGSGQLTTITEPTGRTITLSYHATTGRLTTVTDPRSKSTSLTVDSNGHLTQITGPAGCTMTYAWDASHRITKRTDPRSKDLHIEYKTGTDRVEKLRDHDHPTGSTYVGYVYDTVIEHTGRQYSTDTPPTTPPSGVSGGQTRLDQTTVQLYDNGTKVSEWVVRFDEAGNVWRIIDPLGLHTRCLWGAGGQLIYMSSGYPPSNAPNTADRPYMEDCQQNAMLSMAYDLDGNLLSTVDPNGLMTAMTYNDDKQVTSVSPGLAHYGIQGNWSEHFGKDGWLLCAFDNTSGDRSSLPSYVSSVTQDSLDTLTRANDRSSTYVNVSDPCVPLAPGSREKMSGFWLPSGSSSDKDFTFKVNLPATRSFLLSIYSHEGDLIHSPVTGLELILERRNMCGRDIKLTVTDLDGTRSFQVLNNAVGVWTTFGVRGNSSTPVTVKVEGILAQPRISALAFDTDLDYDPASDPTNRPTFKPQRYLTMAYTSGNLTEVKDGLGNTTTMEYYTDSRKGRLKKVTDARSKVTELDYTDTAKNLTKIKDALLAETTLGYDNNGNLTSIQNPLAHTTTLAYDDENRLISVTDALSNQTVFDYDSSGNLEQVIDANGNRTTMTYTSMNRLASVIEDDDYSGHTGLKLTTTFSWDLWGNLLSVTDPMGNETTFEVDAAHQLVKVHLPDPDDEQQLKMVYNALGRLSALTTPNGTPNDSTYPIDSVDPSGLANLLTNPGAEEFSPFELDSQQSPAWWYPFTSFSSNVAHSGQKSFPVSYSYYFLQPLEIHPGMPLRAKAWVRRNAAINLDAKMLLEFVDRDGYADPEYFTDYAGATCSASKTLTTDATWQEMGPVLFSPPGTLQSRTAHFRIAKGDGSGYTINFDDLELQALGTGYLYDPSGRLTTVDLPDGTRWSRVFDRLGRLVEAVDAMGRKVRLEYDVLDRVRKITDSLNGTYQFFYNATGQLSKFVEPGGAETGYAYDDVGRLSVVTYPDSSTEEYTWNGVGNLTEYQDNLGRTFGFFYDNAERLVEIRYQSLSPTRSVFFTVDDVGNVTAITERNGDATSFTRDGAYRVIGETFTPGSGSSSPSWKHQQTFDANGNRTLLSLGTTSAGRYGTARYGTDRYGEVLWSVPSGGYDQNNRLVQFANGQGLLTEMAYDRESRRTAIEYPNGVTAAASYDFLGHLLSLDYSKGANSILKQLYGYDANSNRVAYVANADTFEYSLDQNQRLVRECLNCLSYRTSEDFQTGSLGGVDSVETTNKLQLLRWDDSFQASYLNLDRWRPVFPQRTFLSNNVITLQAEREEARGMEISQSGGLMFAFARGMTAEVHRDDGGAHRRYPMPARYVSSTHSGGAEAAVEHRVALTGDFEVEVEFDQLQLLSDPSYFGMRVQNGPFERTPIASSEITVYVDLCIAKIGGAIKWRSRHKGPLITLEDISTAVSGTPSKIWMKRTGTSIETKYTDGSGTQSYGTTANLESTASTLYLSLFMNQRFGSYNSVRFKNFKRLDSKEYAASGTWTSPVYDSGRDSTDYDKIYWNETLPTNTDVKFQVYASNTLSNMDNPTYTGPDGTSGSYYSTPTGESFHSGVVGRYFRLKAFLSSNSGQTVTPDFSALRVTYVGGSGANAWSETINTFDSRGNMTRREKTYWNGSATVTDTDVRDDAGWSAGDRINNLNQIKRQDITPAGGATTTWRYTFDSNGRMMSKSDGTNTTSYVWDDDEPRLIEVKLNGVTQVKYAYDSAGRMLVRTPYSGGVAQTPTKLIWDGWTCVKEVTGSSVTRYIAPQGEIHSFERDGQVYQVHSDGHNGSVRAITDASGGAVAHYEFDAWGAQLASSSPFSGGFSYGYVGGLGVRTDAATGLIWMRHRWFDANGLQRFLSRDVLGSLNRYEYCYNDPVNWMDLDGLKPTKTYVHGKPYWHDVVDGVPSYWNTWPDTLRKKEKKKKKKDKCSNDVAFTMIIYPWEAPQWPKPPSGPEPPGLPFPGTNMRYPENVDIRRNMRIARNRLQTSQGADHVDWFKQMVRNSGPWDFKQRHPVYQDFGNFHFGATGHAVGIGDEQLLRAAGWAQYRAGTSRPEWGLPWGDPPYGDDPADQIRIQQGIEWSEQEGF